MYDSSKKQAAQAVMKKERIKEKVNRKTSQITKKLSEKSE